MSNNSLTPSQTAAGLRWLFANRERLGLDLSDLAKLLGRLDGKTIRALEQNTDNLSLSDVTVEITERIGLILGIYKSLTELAPDPLSDHAFEMFQTSIDLIGLQGQSIKEFLLCNPDIRSMRDIRRRVEGVSF